MLLSRITYQVPVAPESHADYAVGSLGRNFDSAACWRRALFTPRGGRRRRATVNDNTTVMERLLLDVLVMTGKQASTKRNSAVMCSVVPAEAGRDLFKRDEGEALVAGAHLHRTRELRRLYMQLCVYTVMYLMNSKISLLSLGH